MSRCCTPLFAGLLLGLLLLSASLQARHGAAAATTVEQIAADTPPLVCVVIRTYYAHGTYGDSSLINLLHSLKAQSHARWHALLLVMDNRPFPDLRHIVRDAGDERIQVFAEWISARHQPRTNDGKQWAPDYHTKLYNLTDEAVRACPRDTRWLVVTNGDNEYDPSFMSVLAAQADAEVVAFDYYSRFQHATGTPCERFAAGGAGPPGSAPPCKANLLTWCHTDLAANAYAWRRFVADDMRFGLLDSGHGASHDGVMADVVRARRWRAAHVSGRCLVDHAPSPQTCATLGGVWDDTAAATDAGAGGRCISAARAADMLATLGRDAELVAVEVSHDTSFGLPEGPLRLQCLRLASPERWKDLATFFPAACAPPAAGADETAPAAATGTAPAA